MCDERQLAEWGRNALAMGTMTRRGFAKVAGAGAGAAALSGCATLGVTGALTEDTVSIPTADGNMDAFFVRPQAKASPAVLFWPDIAGIRESKRQMARRLAGSGYAVLLINPYYRDVVGEQFADFASFAANEGFQKVGPWRSKLSVDSMMRDNRTAADWLVKQDAVDEKRGMGTQGYCMTGSTGLTGPAATPRIVVGASFHGGGLVSDKPNSPHRLIRSGPRYLVAIAQDDDRKAPGDKTALRNAAEAANAQAEIEVYPADHGWCVPDSPAYNEAQAERAWARLLEAYRARL